METIIRMGIKAPMLATSFPNSFSPPMRIETSIIRSIGLNTVSAKLLTEKNKMLSYFDGIQTKQIGWSDSREFGLTIRYKFNTTRSKYKGTGAGNEEKNRL